ncbi:tRNA wybutosine-synthesizing protein 5 isoform X4 [Vigna umbellata]|uniref:tRNA wybutosine-synthesizing protein 5 isoform X4 n=1 Tax=Vigna umbellata TaxID=87088 RepID=UPI001F5E6234|nr:tRNA wybutosine-synthesizing protein 5 isoform X4 [Vigna umbellata]
MESSSSSSIRIRRFDELPTAKDFDSVIELSNVPAVFRGCTKSWKAFSHWNPSNGGLDYLQARVGSCTVEAMVSQSAPVFYGDLGSHQRVPLPFSNFLDFCKKPTQMQSKRHHQGLDHRAASQTDNDTKHACLSLEDAPKQIYLAQVPIMNSDRQETVQLETLKEDIQTPSILASKELSSINLWMNNAEARSSTHYDPHHNLLCIVSGCKRVVLWPPSASPSLYPMPIYGEASNHSSVSLENPDYSIYPRSECSMEFAQKVVLQAGDALFIPEGWFHQVDSDDLTIAVNFWWRSNMMSCMLEHMDAYYLRRILRRLIDKEMHNFPRTLEALVLHVLSPVGAEVLTRKFDEMDQHTLEEDRNGFYEAFYSAFDDQSAAMNSILKGKELFTQQAFKNVLDKFVGVNLEN